MPVTKQLQNTVNYQFLYEFLRAGWSGVGNKVGAKLSIPEHTGIKSYPAREVKGLGRA
jgi:hypothetical protein